jgi:MFS family permease
MEVNKCMEDIGWGPFQYFVIFGVALSWALVNGWFISVSIAIDKLSVAWEMDQFQSGLIGTSFIAGMMTGTLMWGYISDSNGRSLVYKINGVTLALAALIITFAFNFHVALVGFFILGNSIGGDLVNGTTLLTEFLPVSRRWLLALATGAWAIGSTITASMALLFLELELEEMLIFRCCVGILTVF